MVPAPLAVAMLLVAACSGGGAPAEQGSSASSATYPSDEVPEAPLSAACSWPLVSDPDFLNTALPDLAATYWVAALPNIPGTRLRIDGRYPNARYFSFNAYSPLLSAVDALTDYQILPRIAGANPFQTRGAAPGGEYVAYLLPQPVPEIRAPNTLYAGEFPVGLGVTLPANPLQILIYRIYVAEEDLSGGVPLPVLTVETEDGSTALMSLTMTGCASLPPPELLPDLLTRALAGQSAPQAVLSVFENTPLPLTAAEPTMQRAYGLPETLRANMSAALGFDIPGQAVTTTVAADLLNNRDNAYLQAIMSRDKSSMYVVRGKAPIAADDPTEAPLGGAQLRYWSLCSNEIVTQRFADCLYDAQVPLGRDGWFTIVVSDAAERPANAVAENGIGWLAWGAVYPDSMLLYRHMLPSAHFAQAVENIPLNTPPQDVMGEYYPLLAYCDRQTVESAGSDPAAVFAACRERGS